MSGDPITSVFNDGYVDEMFEAYRRDPASVDESWRQFFRFAERLSGGANGMPAGISSTGTATGTVDATSLRDTALQRVAGAASLMDAIRVYGHLAAPIDPLGAPPPGAPELTPEFYGLSEQDLAQLSGAPLSALTFTDSSGSAAQAIAQLRSVYCTALACEFEHLTSADERQWLRQAVETGTYHQPLTADEQRAMLRRLTEVDALDRFLGRAYQGHKRFSIEGSDALVVMLDEIVSLAAQQDAREVTIAMAHRGRLNVLAHVLGKPYAVIFDEFEGIHPDLGEDDITGDVKYHMGYASTRTINGKSMDLLLMPNPSHLEVVAPVHSGVTRAKQRVRPGSRERNEAAVVPVCIHGDAAFPGEGIVPETLNLSRLRGYRVGGTVHIIVNNQVGFTTDPIDARSTHYASDPAKGFDIPVVHVNGDDAAACVQVMRLAFAYRQKFGKDFVVDLVSYRRHGHNETDEPAFTQPTLYQKVRSHPTPRQVWGAKLVRDGIVKEDEVQAIEQEIMSTLEAIQSGDRSDSHGNVSGNEVDTPVVDAPVSADLLMSVNQQLLQWPEGFDVHSRLARTLGRRADAMGESGGIDWGHAEALTFASLVMDGMSVRLTGQDAERGTFAHRQSVLHDSKTGELYIPLQHLKDAKGTVEIYNSPLSETAVMGFEFGYSVEAVDTLTLWEAQYGDFANVAQPIIDQFLSSSHAKWGQDSGLVLLLPHGYEGGGAEHSSARFERFLQLSAENNMRVAYPSTPAQYFHVLRRQAAASIRRPLVLMQPKSLLRLPEAASSLADLTTGTFRPVIDDPIASTQRDKVQRLVFCTGKVYYDLLAQRTDAVALVRIEELYPWPHEQVAGILDLYPNVTDVVWAQEEPRNMGAWFFVWPRLRAATGTTLDIRYIGRPDRASPAEGYAADHMSEQRRIVNEVFAFPKAATGKRAKKTATR